MAENGAVDATVTSAAQRRLAAWIPGYEAELAPRLGRDLCLVDCAADMPRPDMLSVVVELGAERDAIVAAWQSRPGIFTGPVTREPDGRSVPARPHRSAGSAPKLLAAPLFVEGGIDRVCRRAWAGLHDADGHTGFPCTEAHHYLGLAEAIARSSNLAYAEAIRRVGLARVRAWLEALGLVIRDRRGAAALRFSIASGENVATSPRVLLRALAALARGAHGAAPAAGQPSLLDRVGRERPDAIDLGRLGISRELLAASRPVLAAPIVRPEGTLHGLLDPLVDLGCSQQSLIGKSATSEARSPTGTGVRDKLVYLHATCGGHRYAVLAMVGSPRIDVPLGRIRTADVGRLALTTLEAALATADLQHR